MVLSGLQCKVKLAGSPPPQRSQFEGLASSLLHLALNKARCYFLDYLVRLSAGLQSLSIAEPLQRAITGVI